MTREVQHSAGARSTERIMLARLCILILLSSVAPLASDLHLPAFPDMAQEFGAEPWQIQLTMSTFLLGLAAGQLIVGPLSDRFGRRPLLLIGTHQPASFEELTK